MREVWVLSMCSVSEGGGDVMHAELFASSEDAEKRVAYYARTNEYWGCVDWAIHKEEVPIEPKEGQSND